MFEDYHAMQDGYDGLEKKWESNSANWSAEKKIANLKARISMADKYVVFTTYFTHHSME